MFQNLTKSRREMEELSAALESLINGEDPALDRISEDTPDCTESSLKVHISNLRKKLKAVDGKDYIEAVWGIGFKLNEEL